MFNFRDRAIFDAKGIKVLFDKSVRPAICQAIEIYFKEDDDTTCELIFGITNLGDKDYFLDAKVVDLFKRIAKTGGIFSRQEVLEQFTLYKENENPDFEWRNFDGLKHKKI